MTTRPIACRSICPHCRTHTYFNVPRDITPSPRRGEDRVKCYACGCDYRLFRDGGER